MNAVAERITIPTEPGTPFEGGFYAGRIRVGEQVFAIVVAPKAHGELQDVAWHSKYDRITEAQSVNDGRNNTLAIAEQGSKLAKQILALDIGGHRDWYLPSRDELEVIYRNLKPTTDENTLYARSGENVSAVPPTYAYTEVEPKQTTATAFQQGGEEAFIDAAYWSSTQVAGLSGSAWAQGFGHGSQYYWRKDDEFHARAVRRVLVIQ